MPSRHHAMRPALGKHASTPATRGEGMPTTDEIRKVVEENFRNFETLPEPMLREKVQAFALEAELISPGTGGVEGIPLFENLPQVREAICRAFFEKKIADNWNTGTVTDVTTLLLVAFAPTVQAIPQLGQIAGFAAMAALALRAGLGVYCRGYRLSGSGTPPSSP
jgi:hypothetical protein